MADRVHRVTMFKLPKADDQQRLLEQYKKLGETHLKVSRIRIGLVLFVRNTASPACMPCLRRPGVSFDALDRVQIPLYPHIPHPRRQQQQHDHDLASPLKPH